MVELAVWFPELGAAAEVRDLGGSRVGLRVGDRIEVTAEIDEVRGNSAVVRVRSDLHDELASLADAAHAAPADGPDRTVPTIVEWTELNDLASVDASIVRDGSGELVVECSWPPRRVQRRALRRLLVELPVWFVRTGDGSVVQGVTHDVSGGGLSVRLPDSPLVARERVVTMLRADDRDLVIPSIVHWERPDQSALGVRFERISQPDQDHLVRLVSLGEAVRGR